MKKLLLKIVKMNPFLYKIAVWVHRKLNPIKAIPKRNSYKYICYSLNNLDELIKIQKHYNLIKNENTRLVVIINNSNYNLQIHNLIEENPKVIFLSYDYIKRYNKKINLTNSIFLDYNTYPSELIYDLI